MFVAFLSIKSLALAEVDFDHIDWQKERTFWAFTPPKAPERPEVKNQRWPRQDVDYFVLAKLEERRLSPALEAERPSCAEGARGLAGQKGSSVCQALGSALTTCSVPTQQRAGEVSGRRTPPHAAAW